MEATGTAGAALTDHALAYVSRHGFDAEDDPTTRVYLYQQQLRAELLAAAHEEAIRPALWRRAWQATVRVDLVLDVAHAIQNRARALGEAGAAAAYRQRVALEPVPARA